jgi:DNA repair photolyase
MAAALKIRGTKEWAVANIDCCTGCSHGCRYCYARYDAVVKNKNVKAADWENPVVRPEDVERDFPCYPGQVMFPATHDILPSNLQDCVRVIEGLIASGNRILVVSKPHIDCITYLCRHFEKNREQILFRFTITAKDNTILKFWEPSAPSYEERRACLEYAFAMQYQTSVSIEPMLDTENVVHLVEELMPWVTHSLWLGRMNKVENRVVCDSKEMELELLRICEGQTTAKIVQIYHQLKDNPLVRWKESVKEDVGLELVTESGLDI